MKVLHIITGDTWAGAEAQMSGLVQPLRSRHGVEQEVVTFNDGALASRLRQQGVRVETVSESGRPLTSLVAACAGIIAKFRPDIVHTHGFKENLVGGLSARLNGVKVIRTHHGKGMLGGAFRYRVIEKVNERLLSHRLIAVSQDLGAFLVQFGLAEKKITVVLNGVNPIEPSPPARVIELKRELGLPTDWIVVGTTGRLVPVKEHSVFLRGARTILEADSRAGFIIIGDGPLMSRLAREAEALGIKDRTLFAGFREDAARLADVFDIFALTSRHEGVPMALLEAMSLGKPVVATRVGGLPEIITDGSNGLLVPPDDPNAFALACLTLIGNQSLRMRLSERAANDVTERFSLDVCASRTFGVYQEVLSA